MSDAYPSGIYVGNSPGSQEIYTHAEIIDNILTIESAVLEGPITFTETVTVTGTLVIV